MTTHLDPPNIEWQRVSRKLIVAELLGDVLFLGAAIVVSIVFTTLGHAWAPYTLGTAIVLLAGSLIFTSRRVRAYGYQLRADDIVFRKGIMFLRVVAVPYGRMQLVDINRGPVSRALGLSELKFVTAAAASAVAIPGLPFAEAEALRDRLVALAESRRAGL